MYEVSDFELFRGYRGHMMAKVTTSEGVFTIAPEELYLRKMYNELEEFGVPAEMLKRLESAVGDYGQYQYETGMEEAEEEL